MNLPRTRIDPSMEAPGCGASKQATWRFMRAIAWFTSFGLLAGVGAASAQPLPPDAPRPPAQRDVPPAPPEPPRVPPPPDASVKPTREPARTPVKASRAISVAYDKGVLLRSDDETLELRINLRNQFRFESTRPTEDNAQFVSHFLIPRSRLQADGFVFGATNRYKLEFSFGDTGGFSFVKDLYVEKRLGGPAWIRVGQWKRPFNRQEMVSDFASEFNERANTATFAGGGRDLGVAIHNEYEKSPEGLEWVVGVFNGFNGGADRPSLTTTCKQSPMTSAITCVNSAPTTVPADFGPAVVARVGWNSGRIRGYSEGDLESGPPRIAVGLSYKIDLANFAKGKEDSVAHNLSHGVEADAMFKVDGFGVELGAYLMKLKSGDSQFAVLAQPGYFVVPKHAQVAARFALAPIGTRKQIEGRAAFNWYWEGHAWKWATDAGFVQLTGTDPMTMATDKPDLQFRTMLQLTF